jgi:hypothetical protein
MWRSHVRLLGIVAATAAAAGCNLVGPSSIDSGRDRYNSAIHSTSMEQTMSNIVRVYQNEPTTFMDVSEVDASMNFGGSLQGAATGIGARATNSTSAGTLAGRLGSATGTVQYSETPTVRYLPLLGQPLVAQLVTPVSVDALGLLYDSFWPAASVLDFAAAYLTLDYGEFFSALDTVIELDDRSAVQITAGKSGLPKPPEPADKKSSSDKDTKKPSDNSNDSLFIFLRPLQAGKATPDAGQQKSDSVWVKRRVLQLWVRLLRIYGGTQPDFDPDPGAKRCAEIGLAINRQTGWFSSDQLRSWDVNIRSKPGADLDAARACLPNSIELRVVPEPRDQPVKGKKTNISDVHLITRAPLMRTYSALGILKNAVERPHERIEFVTPERYRAIRDAATHPWNGDPDELAYYTLLPEDEDSVDCDDSAAKEHGCDDPMPAKGPERTRFLAITATLSDWLRRYATHEAPPDPAADPYSGDLFAYEKPGDDALDDDHITINRRLGFLRRYILIIVSNGPPDVPVYASYFDRGRWYYIAQDDPVSQKNFHLLSLFMTMMAVPPATQPLSPVISVGGGG